MSDRAEFEKRLHVPEGALWSEKKQGYYWSNYPTVAHPVNDDWEVWQEALEYARAHGATVPMTRIAEKKLEQMGGDVCGVLVRKDGKLAAVDEHGRVQWLQSGKGAEPVAWLVENTFTGSATLYRSEAQAKAHRCLAVEIDEQDSAKVITPLYTHPHNDEQGGEWVKCSERLPTEADGFVWVYNTHTKAVLWQPHTWRTINMWSDRENCLWTPTGLKRPQPPKQEGYGDE